jgi:hypothetical protein
LLARHGSLRYSAIRPEQPGVEDCVPHRQQRSTFGTFVFTQRLFLGCACAQEANMNGLIYLIGLIVVIMAILSFFGLR